jgi:hypothetical protein
MTWLRLTIGSNYLQTKNMHWHESIAGIPLLFLFHTSRQYSSQKHLLPSPPLRKQSDQLSDCFLGALSGSPLFRCRLVQYDRRSNLALRSESSVIGGKHGCRYRTRNWRLPPKRSKIMWKLVSYHPEDPQHRSCCL